MTNKRKNAKPRHPGITFADPHLTKQDHGGSADINYIAQQYASGRLPYPEKPPAFYGDVSAVDVQRSREVLAEVESTFSALPSEVRDHFRYDSKNYVAWLNNNGEDIAEYGIRRALFNAVNPQEREEIAQNPLEDNATEPESGDQQHS